MSHGLVSLVSMFARLYPWQVETSDEFREPFVFLEWDISPAQVVRAGYGVGFVVGLISALAIPVVPAQLRVVAGVLSCGLTLVVIHLVHSLPKVASRAKRTGALGSAPDLIARAVLRMRLSPTPERAAEFAAQTSTGALAASLRTHVRLTHNTAETGMASFGEAWADLFPALERSVALLEVAGRTASEDRARLLDRALAVVLEETQDELQTFATRIRVPMTALYAFGVLLPTALVALLPAVGAAGIIVSPVPVVILYNIVLPIILVGASVWFFLHRPVAFPPPDITRHHPAVSDRAALAVASGLCVGVVGWITATRLFPFWGPPIAAGGLGVGTVLVVVYHPVIEVYDRVRAVEGGLADALELIGRRVANGEAVETAIAQVGDELEGPLGSLIAEGATQQRQIHVGVREAFLGRDGVLNAVPSPRVRGSFSLLSLATTEGRPAGIALLAFAEHLGRLQRIEREARDQLISICQTLRNTATVFGPMVAGATVALADSITGAAELLESEQSFGWLGGPVGVYVVLLAILLTALSVSLIRGFDRSLLGYHVGRSLVISTLVYLCSYLVVGVFV